MIAWRVEHMLLARDGARQKDRKFKDHQGNLVIPCHTKEARHQCEKACLVHAHIHHELGILFQPDFIILGALFRKLYPDCCLHGSSPSGFSAQHPGSFVLGIPDCFLTLRMLSMLVSGFSGAETMANEVTWALESRGPRGLS